MEHLFGYLDVNGIFLSILLQNNPLIGLYRSLMKNSKTMQFLKDCILQYKNLNTNLDLIKIIHTFCQILFHN